MLAEDVPHGDLTTDGMGIGNRSARLTMSARQAMCLCGSEEAARLIELCGGCVLSHRASGERLAAQAEILQAQGDAASLHRAWKTAQTLMEYLSGMASCAAGILDELRGAGFDLPLACTRKNLPGTRILAIKAVRAGGAIAHRLGLSETLLVFPEHRAFVDKADLPALFAQMHRQNPEKKLVAEVGDMAEALWLAECGADVLQLERFNPEALSECRQALRSKGLAPLLAPAGGVTRSNALAFAQAGADFLVSSAPYFAPPCDVKVQLQPA